MNTEQIFKRITRRTGEGDPVVLTDECNYELTQLWRETDCPGSIMELFVRTGSEPVITLPPYVYQLKGVRHSAGAQVTLFTPRPYYDDGHVSQTFLEMRELTKSPLVQQLSGIGRLTAKLLAPADDTFRVTIAGPDLSNNYAISNLDFGVDDTAKETSKAFTDVVEISKDKVTSSDVLIYDIGGNLVSILLADKERAENIVLRIADPMVTVVTYTNTVFSCLYKKHPPRFKLDTNISLEDATAVTLIDKVSAELLTLSKDQGDQGRARAYEKRADKRMDNMVMREAEGKQEYLKLTTSGHYHLYSGTL